MDRTQTPDRLASYINYPIIKYISVRRESNDLPLHDWTRTVALIFMGDLPSCMPIG